MAACGTGQKMEEHNLEGNKTGEYQHAHLQYHGKAAPANWDQLSEEEKKKELEKLRENFTNKKQAEVDHIKVDAEKLKDDAGKDEIGNPRGWAD
ncbi:hypothetical protein KFL_000170030 [Klebsormidium nitens]|uniref:Uncharacterized protein n=1 Tax=Klebsormidium nitens TaxID=105231 RepID=A0A1Y1HQ08_KLENI|nr:hypothetical protein KFL_000170030 [Klebsormidium nitens]|eukprot:GAQ78657.1 hypothetical protein KFL_000170030 [Klebsormidium nitens]